MVTYRMSKIIGLVDTANEDWNQIVDSIKSRNFFESFKYYDENEIRNFINDVSYKLAFVIERYMKALYLLKIDLPVSVKNELLNESFTDADIVDLIINENTPNSASLRGKLSGQGRKDLKAITFMDISHNFTRIFNSNDLDINIYNIIRKNFVRNMAVMQSTNPYQLSSTNENDMISKLDLPEFADAFIKGRYSGLNTFIADFKSLLSFVFGVQSMISLETNGIGIFTSNGKDNLSFADYNNSTDIINFSRIKTIYPDLNTTIKINNTRYYDVVQNENHIGLTNQEMSSLPPRINLLLKDNDVLSYYFNGQERYLCCINSCLIGVNNQFIKDKQVTTNEHIR